METLQLVGSVLGGLGLFLLAIGMMTDGLKLAAGSSLRTLLSQWSKTPLRGIFSGFLMTAIVQSSSAVTVATIGFVNAGLLNMRQALGIIYGSNVGTTMTGWLVALIGFKLDIQAFALPMIGVGMFLKLINQQGKAGSFGLALVGFGLFFVGIDVLKNAFDGVVQLFDISQFTAEGVSAMVIFLCFGVLMTILTQSSSASIALTITAASTGMVGIYAAGAMVIGANIGTTSTAVLAAIGATSHAKRVAAAQVIFNLATAIVALLVLPVLFYVIAWGSEIFEIEANPAISLALFHTIFNVLGVLIMYPQNTRLAIFLEQRFKTWEESEAKPKYLDKTIAQTPVLAVNALTLETLAISDRVISLYTKAITPHFYAYKVFDDETKVIKTLLSEVSKFIVSIQTTAMGEDTTESFANLMRIEQYLLSCTLSTERIGFQLNQREALSQPQIEAETSAYFQQILGFMQTSRQRISEVNDVYNEQFIHLQSQHDKIKANLILQGTLSHIGIGQMSDTIDCMSEALRMSQQWFKAFIRLQNIQAELASLAPPILTETP